MLLFGEAHHIQARSPPSATSAALAALASSCTLAASHLPSRSTLALSPLSHPRLHPHCQLGPRRICTAPVHTLARTRVIAGTLSPAAVYRGEAGTSTGTRGP